MFSWSTVGKLESSQFFSLFSFFFFCGGREGSGVSFFSSILFVLVDREFFILFYFNFFILNMSLYLVSSLFKTANIQLGL